MNEIIALDIGGTKIEGVLFNDKLKILKKKRVYFEKEKTKSIVTLSRKKVLNMIYSIIDELKTDNIKGIGISIPDIITKDGSISGKSKIQALSNFKLAKYFSKKYKCTVRAANDADCFALGETLFGTGKGHNNVIGVIAGTGIGSGIIINKKIYSGSKGSAGEFGYIVVDPDGPIDRHNMKGTVQAYASGPNIVRNYINAGGKIIDPDPKKIFSSKEPIAKKIIDEALEKLAIGLASLQNIINPDIIIIGGGLSNLNFYKKLNSYTKKYTIDSLKKHVKIVKNSLGDSAGTYGAAALFK